MSSKVTLPHNFTFPQYLDFVKALVHEGKTSGPDQSEQMVYYTGLNLVRMERIKKTFVFTEELSEAVRSLQDQYKFVVLTEAWCGDAAQAIPVMGAIAELAEGKIDLQLLLRDENPELMDQFLTNGGRSIPKLIIYNRHGEVLASWGPRPDILQEYMVSLKEAEVPMDLSQMIEKVQLWYAKDRTLSVQRELAAVIAGLS
jgi:hypothetical protein